MRASDDGERNGKIGNLPKKCGMGNSLRVGCDEVVFLIR